MEKQMLDLLKKALIEEHDKLVAELKSIASPDPRMKGDWDAKFPKFEPVETGASSHLEEVADEVEEYETRLEAEHTLESRLLAVNKALERMQQRTYGTCIKCKKEILLERLQANPAAEAHVEHSN